MLARIASAAVVITTRAGTCRRTSLNAALRPIPTLIPIISQDEIESSDDEPATSNPKTIRTTACNAKGCAVGSCDLITGQLFRRFVTLSRNIKKEKTRNIRGEKARFRLQRTAAMMVPTAMMQTIAAVHTIEKIVGRFLS